MHSCEKQFIECISAAIRGYKINTICDREVDWLEVFKKAEDHNVKPLVYSSLRNDIYKINDKLFNDVKRYTILASVLQIQHMKQVEKVFKEFNDNKISVIGLKGAALRNLYPRPEFRTMSDLDLLVRKGDIENSEKILLKLGYVRFGITKNHLSFKHKRFLNIDLHWTIDDKRGEGNVSDLENEIWNNTIKMSIGQASFLSLSWEDMLIHLLIHMAGHVVYSGFGIRQMCDVVLVIERKGHLINWESFYNKIRTIRIEKLMVVVFMACKSLFGMEVPEIVNNRIKDENENLNKFINYICLGGVYGRKDFASVYGGKLAFNIYNHNLKYIIITMKQIISQIVKAIFPHIKKIYEEFPYSKRCTVLLPVAWVHYISRHILRAKSIIFFIPMSINRYRLFKYLNL
ncbi:nucleotidyltransferase domain-containing protein [Clostridium oryzae]|uniref:Nucleotidyltransferase family protein n=1 Tax=Clostridium oryzae TaxID=1450648 RepID=A0A1V4IRR5_9CLOT|nr:nucleotidyltransferase family protein [Clostridium oryzae]OPJ62712.1 hypothetical protein CLORY_15920 [Clostridium oryzae]